MERVYYILGEQVDDYIKFGKDYFCPQGLSPDVDTDLLGEGPEYAESIKSAAVFGGVLVLSFISLVSYIFSRNKKEERIMETEN